LAENYFFMAKYFSLNELVSSETAAARGIDNTPPPYAAARLGVLAERLLDPVRELWGAPLRVDSGYRCPELNRAVGGAAGSQHLSGEAADITTGSREGNRRLFGMIVAAIGLEPDAGRPPAVSLSHSLRAPYGRSEVEKCPCRTRTSVAIQRHCNLADLGQSLDFDQLIDESGYSWLHISYREGKNRRQILHI
jgi:hypothetical protein